MTRTFVSGQYICLWTTRQEPQGRSGSTRPYGHPESRRTRLANRNAESKTSRSTRSYRPARLSAGFRLCRSLLSANTPFPHHSAWLHERLDSSECSRQAAVVCSHGVLECAPAPACTAGSDESDTALVRWVCGRVDHQHAVLPMRAATRLRVCAFRGPAVDAADAGDACTRCCLP